MANLRIVLAIDKIAIHEYIYHVRECLNILQWIAIDNQDVGFFSNFKAACEFINSTRFRRIKGS